MDITEKEGILKAARVSKKAKGILEKAFPKVFEKDKYFDLDKLSSNKYFIFSFNNAIMAGFMDNDFFQIRRHGEYAGRAFFLSNSYNWELKKDKVGKLCLIPTKKDKK